MAATNSGTSVQVTKVSAAGSLVWSRSSIAGLAGAPTPRNAGRSTPRVCVGPRPNANPAAPAPPQLVFAQDGRRPHRDIFRLFNEAAPKPELRAAQGPHLAMACEYWPGIAWVMRPDRRPA